MTGALNDAALDWAVRVADPEFAAWDDFMAWLEGGAGRAEAYDAAVATLALAEAQVAALASPRPEAIPEEVAPMRRRWIGAALAAALVGAVGLNLWNDRARPYVIETPAATQRTLALADGSEIVLAGGSSVELDRNDPRVASVVRGEMLFRVRHQAANPFRVRVGDLRLVDLGTVFDVKRDARVTRVAVSEGTVMVDPDGAALRLDPGQAVVASGNGLQRLTIDPADVGGWREGRLAFDDATLAEVAADLSRHLARPIAVDPAIAGRTFRGTLDVRDAGADPQVLGSLLGVRVRQRDGGWILEPRG